MSVKAEGARCPPRESRYAHCRICAFVSTLHQKCMTSAEPRGWITYICFQHATSHKYCRLFSDHDFYTPMDKPIAALYACYLLRSTVRHSSLYIGSTPHPVRRLRQHNGDAKGGAARTSRDSLRPWEMTCLVTGFPSKIAALQFEWAWQNPNLTRHIAPDSRITQTKMTSRISPKTGRVRKRTARPRFSLTDRLANLHLLLQSNSFERWPLKITFYAEDVFKVWQKWTTMHSEKLRSGINAVLDRSVFDEAPPSAQNNDASTPAIARGIHALDVSYIPMKPYLEKSQGILSSSTVISCVICQKLIPNSGAAALVCPESGCSALTHMECLSSAFLQSEGAANAVVPTQGLCPKCKTTLQWVDLVKALSLRMRGDKEIKALFKPKRSRKTSAPEAVAESGNSCSGEDEAPDDLDNEEIVWNELSDGSEDGAPVHHASPDHVKAVSKAAVISPSHSEPVIDESDWENAEIVT